MSEAGKRTAHEVPEGAKPIAAITSALIRLADIVKEARAEHASLLARVEELEGSLEIWKDRWRTEAQAHEETIKHLERERDEWS